MKLYSPNLFSRLYAARTFTGVNAELVSRIFDQDDSSVTNTASPNPILDLNLGPSNDSEFAGPLIANSLWMRTRVATSFRLQTSTNGTTYTNVGIDPVTIPSDGYTYHEFTAVTSRYWRIRFFGAPMGAGVYACYLANRLVDFDTPTKRPIRWRVAKFAGIFERANNTSLVALTPFSYGDQRATVTLEWDNLPDDNVKELYDAWLTGRKTNGLFCVYPVPTYRPRHFFEARWETNFQFRHTSGIERGQAGNIVLQELKTRIR